MNKIKSILAFVALMLCGGAWAALNPVAVWDGDFSQTEKVDGEGRSYKLNLNGQATVSADGTYLQMNSDATSGVQISFSSAITGANGVTVVVNFADVTAQDCFALGFKKATTALDLCGSGLTSSKLTRLYQTNYGYYTAANNESNKISDFSDFEYCLSYKYSSGTATWKFKSGSWSSQSKSEIKESNANIDGVSIGGTWTTSSAGATASLTGAKIKSIVILKDGVSEAADLAAYKASSTNDAEYFTTITSDTAFADLVWKNASDETVSLPATVDASVKMAIRGTGKVSFTGTFGGSVYLEKGIELVPTAGVAATAKLTGYGTITYPTTALPGDEKSCYTAATWSGTVALNYTTKHQFAFSGYGNARSVLRLTGVNGYAPNDDNASFGGTIELKDNGNTNAWTINDAYQKRYTVGKLIGDGTFIVSGTQSSQAKYLILDASEFNGEFHTGGNNKSVTIGGERAKTSDLAADGNIAVRTGGVANIARDKTWSAKANGSITINGTIKGVGTLGSNAIFGDGATIDITGNTEDAALAMEQGKTVTFNGSLNLAGTIESGSVVLKGLSSEPELSFMTVSVNGSVVPGAHLYYENGALKYSNQISSFWTPNPNSACVDANGIFDWTAPNAWKDTTGADATWSVTADAEDKPDVYIDATRIKGVKIEGQIYVGNVTVVGTLGAEESFQFHNHTCGVDGESEVEEDGDCLRAAKVNLTGLVGELGMKVPITGDIAFGANAHLVFATGTDENPSTAYGYTFLDRGGSIAVEGSGKFVVPSSMYAISFASASGAKLVYALNSNATVSGTISGACSIIKEGTGILTFSGTNSFTGGTTISEGTIKLGVQKGLGEQGSAVTVEENGVLDVNGTQNHGIVLTLAGGTVKNTGGGVSTGNVQFRSISLTADSTIDLAASTGVVNNSYGATTLQLNNHKLVKNGTGVFLLAAVTVSNGTIEIGGGSVKVEQSQCTFNNVAFTVPSTAAANMVVQNAALTTAPVNTIFQQTERAGGEEIILVSSGATPTYKLETGNGATIKDGDVIIINGSLWQANRWVLSNLPAGHKIKITNETDIDSIPANASLTIDYKNYPESGNKMGVYLRGNIGENATIDGTGALFLGFTENATIGDGVTISCDVGFQTTGKHQIVASNATATLSGNYIHIAGSSIKLNEGAKLIVQEQLPDGAVESNVANRAVYFNETTKTYELEVAKAFEAVPGTSASGWFSDWGGEKDGAARSVVTGNGVESFRMVHHDGNGESEKWHPYVRGNNFAAKNAYTMSVYGTADLVVPETGKYKVLWSFGQNANAHVLAKDGDGNIVFFKNANGTVSNKISAGVLSGYHLITVTFSTTKGAAIWVDGEMKASDSTFTTAAAAGLQIGGVFQGTYDPMKQGVGYVPTYIWAAEAIAPDAQIAALSAAHPAATTFNVNVNFTTAGAKLYLPSMTNTSGNLFQVSGGTLVVPSSVTATLDSVEFGDGVSLNLGATLSANNIVITGAVTITSDSTGTLSGSSIKLMTAASTLTVPTKLADDAVTTDIEGKFVDFNETNKTYLVADKIAKIGDKNYSSVGAAITAATAGQTVEIVANSTETIALTKDVTISVADGQSFSLTKLTGSYNVTKVGAGTLTVNCGVPSGKTLNVNEGTLTLKCDGEAIVGTVNIAADATLDMSTSGYGDRINYRAGNSPIINVKGTWLLGENRQTINNTVTLNVYAGATISGAGDNNDSYACALDFLGTNTVHFYKNSDDEENAEATLATVITPRAGNNNSVTFSIPEGMTVNWTGAKRSDEQTANCNKKGDGKVVVSGGGALKMSAPSARPIVFGEAILDLSGFTTSSATVFAGGLTIGEDTTIKFPEGFAEDAEFTLTNGSLTSEAGATVSDKMILVGATEKTVTLTFGEHTVAYSVTNPNDTWTYNKASGNWSDEDAWTDPTGVTHSWSDATARTIAVFDASQTSAILVDDIYAPKMVQLIGTGDEFVFHNGTGGVNGMVELDAEQYCINAPVLTTGFTGNLGLRVAITGRISFGLTTKLIFSSGDVGDVTTAYAYTIDGRTNPIGVSGSGKFIVPSSMYGIAFDVESKATAVYQEASATITGAITGTGTVEFKNGVTKDLGAAVKDQTLHYVSSGTTPNTLAWTGDGSTSFTSTDSKTKPVVKVESDATLKLNAHDCSGWNGGLTEHGWFVNNGTLVFSKPTGTRFWRDHIVFGSGSTMRIDTGDHHIYMYGGVGTADNCQLTLASGEATIEKGVVNSGASYSLYIGFTGDGYASKDSKNKGVGINVGTDATLTVSVPLMGGDPMAKYGAGTLVLEDNSAYTGSIALYGGSIKAASQIDLNRFTSKDPYRPAVSETHEGEMYVYALSYGKIKVDACGYLDVAEAMKHLTTSSTIEIIDTTTITKGSLESDYGITLTPGEGNTFTVSVAEAQMEGADEHNLIFSEIMPKPSDKPSSITTEAGYDENGLESGWVELENTSTTKWVDLAKYKFLRVNRSKATSKGDYGAFPSVLIPPRAKFVFYTSERYSNSADMTVSAWATPHPSCVDAKGKAAPKPILYGAELHNMLVWPDKINPKKFPFVRLMKDSTIIDTVVIPSDIPEGHSIIVTPITEEYATVRYMTNKPTKGTANTSLDDASIVKLGPNVGPLYEIAGGEKHSSVSEFGAVEMATPGEDYVINFSLNPTMSPTEAAGFRAKDAITGIKLVYRTWGGTVDAPTQTAPAKIDVTIPAEGNFDAADRGYQYSVTIPKENLPGAGQLIQWKFEVTDAAGNEWTTPSFHNKDDGYEWYGTIVDPGETEGLTSASLPNWHMFVTSESKEQMDKDAPNQTIANNARVAIYDASTKCYYDYVRIDLRGNTSSRFGKKSHGLRFSKANPLMMTDIVTGKPIVSAVRKSSLISEFGDPSYVRQMTAFWLLNKVGSPAPFDFPVHCNLNGQFYQLAFHSERFTDELIEDFHGLDKFGYGYKNVGVFTTDGTTSGGIEKKTPDDGNEGDDSKLRELYPLIAESVPAAQRTANVVKLFDLPAWINYLAATRITQETDDVWGNISAYLDDAEMKEKNAYRGTGTWMPLAYDMNQSFGQWHYGDLNGDRTGLMATEDWHKSHPFYGGDAVRCYESPTFTNPGRFRWNRAIDAVYQSEKFRRLYLRRLRTLMDQELGEPNDDATYKTDNSPIMVFIRQMADKMTADAAADRTKWGGLGSSQDKASAINVWPSDKWNMTQAEGIQDLYDNYIVPRRRHLFETHSINNTAKTVGYGTEFNAGIPDKQSDIATLKDNITIANLTELSSEKVTELAIPAWFTNKKVLVIHNANNEAVDMSGWKLSYSVEFTLPAGTVVDANDDLYVVADRRAYIEQLADSITDQVIVGNAKMTGAGPIMLTTAEGVEVVKIVPMTDARRYLRLNSFYGNTTGTKGDVDEWFVITNTSNSVTLDFKSAPVTICFLKDDKTVTEETDAGKHCHVTIDSGSLKPGKVLRCEQATYADKGWSKIQNNKQIINIYDMYGVSGQTLKVTQKDYPFAYGHGAFLETTSTATTVKNSDWIQVWTEGDLTIGNFTADGIDGMAKDLTVRATAPMTIDLQNPTFGDKASLKIEGATSVVTIKGTATKTVAGPTVIKSKGSLVFEDGVYDLISTDDCIQADGDITINGGTFICHSTGNDGIDSNQNIVINGGTIFAFTAANEAEEGADPQYSTGLDVNEGKSITINGGTIIATSATSAALEKLTLAGSQAAKVVAVTGLTADEAKTIAIADILVPFPAMTTVPTAVLVSKPGMTEDSTVVVEKETPGTVEIVAGNVETDTAAVHATVPASWIDGKVGDAKVAAAEAFVLGLAEPTEKPMVSSEQTTKADSIRIVDNVAPRFGTGVTVKRTLFVGTTPGEEAADNTIEETNGGFTVPLPKGSEPKVKYIKIKYSFK